MGIISRFSDIMKSNINALLDKCEDPEKMIDQKLRDLREDLAEVKKETAGVMADAKDANRRVEECEQQIKKYTTAAENALRKGNEEDAKTLIAQKQQYDASLAQLQKNKAIADENASKMRAMHDKLVSDISALEVKQHTIKATIRTAKTQDHMNKMAAGTARGKASMDTIDRMEQKANAMLDAAMAEADLNAGVSATSELAEKYTTGSDSISVDDEIAAMKAKLGL